MEINRPEIEKSKTILGEWFRNLSETQIVGKLDRDVLRSVFESLGANFEIGELRNSFFRESYSNKQRSEAMKVVWGENYQNYKDWCDAFVEDYEKTKETTLPRIVFPKTGTVDKTSGLRQLFGELTAYAVTEDAEFSFQDLKQRLEAQAMNGRLWSAGVKEKVDRIKIEVNDYNNGRPFAPASFPPGFVAEAWNFLQTWGSLSN